MRRPRGFVRMAILHLLEEKPMHGYGIMKALEARADGFYSASAGTIYPALQELVRRDLIMIKEESDKKTYVINEQGEAKLKEFNSKHEVNFWVNWKERWVWQSSEEAGQLYIAIDEWETELRKTMRRVRKSPDQTKQLITFINDITEQLKSDNE